MAGCHRDLMDGEIQVGDVVVSHVNGTFDFYSIAIVLSAIGDLTLRGISTIEGEDAALMRACELQKDGRAVWLFPGPPRDEETCRADHFSEQLRRKVSAAPAARLYVGGLHRQSPSLKRLPQSACARSSLVSTAAMRRRVLS
jgi:hypothetical protein